MPRILLYSLHFLVFLLCPLSAVAFVDPPALWPPHPLARKDVYVQVRGGVCDRFMYGQPGYPQIERTGARVRIVLPATHDTDPLFCNAPPNTYSALVGAFPAGNYVLQVDRHYEGSESETTETLGVIGFSVVNPAGLPALAVVARACLPLLLALLAIYRARMARTPR